MKSHYKKIILLLTLILFSFGVGTTELGMANEGQTNSKKSDIMDIITDQYGEFKDDGKSYYHLDAVSDKDVETFDDGADFWADTYDKLFGWADVKENVGNKLSEMVNLVNNIVFDINIFLTYTMLVMYDLAYTADFTEKIIIELESIMDNITGISGGTFNIGTGLFGNLVKLIAVLTGMYALYIFIVKRAFFETFSSVFQTVIALTVAIFMFANYTALLTGANKITTELSGFVVSLPSHSEGQESNIEDPRTKMKDSIWGMFVDRPYLYMQYGTHDVAALGGGDRSMGVERVKSILKEPVGESRLTKVVEDEASEKSGKGNNMMKYSAVNSRLAFTYFYMVINGLVSLPIYLLSLCLILFQFWFMVIATLAPFALLIAAIPGQFNVMKRYFIELGIPLALKIFVSFVALIVFVISDIIYAADFKSLTGGSNPFYSYVGAATFNLLLFATIFILRNRIKDIFSSGSNTIRALRESSGTFNAPFKKGMQNVATAGGAVAGAVTGGPAGAMTGAAIGGSVGRVVTGEGSVSDVAGSAMKAQHLVHLSKMSQSGKDKTLSGMDKSRPENVLTGKEHNPQMKKEAMKTFEKAGLNQLSDDELAEQIEKNSSEGNFAKTIENGSITDERRSFQLQAEKQNLYGEEENGLPMNRTMITNELSNRGLPSEMIDLTLNTLKSQGIDDLSQSEMERHFDLVVDKAEQGEWENGFADTFVANIQNERNTVEEKERKALMKENNLKSLRDLQK
ncbi:CD3337/EF1877 family mobilome membrane protein [Sporosarcina sp. 179-K 8C2 HS]|uniref:CD3337/EF1877 family mobilome membrane protein n=1 Tax=Sporosarcina sp. 179-K 8C2 HS TaxID=3142387 RepID=UPI0039A3AB28